jgi:hypothetical protein
MDINRHRRPLDRRALRRAQWGRFSFENCGERCLPISGIVGRTEGHIVLIGSFTEIFGDDSFENNEFEFCFDAETDDNAIWGCDIEGGDLVFSMH